MREPRNRVVQVRRFGGPDELEVVDAPLPTAGHGEVRVRVLASSVEYTDVVIRRHLYPWVFRRPPFVMGYDVIGEIDQLGDGVSDLHLGDRVADMTVLGSNAAYRTLRADHLTRVPAGVDMAEAAALILSWTTAYQLLHRTARVQRGQRVGRDIPPGSMRTLSGSSSCWQLAPSGRASPSGSPSMRSPRHTAVSRRVVSTASSSCARICRCAATGRRLPREPGPPR